MPHQTRTDASVANQAQLTRTHKKTPLTKGSLFLAQITHDNLIITTIVIRYVGTVWPLSTAWPAGTPTTYVCLVRDKLRFPLRHPDTKGAKPSCSWGLHRWSAGAPFSALLSETKEVISNNVTRGHLRVRLCPQLYFPWFPWEIQSFLLAGREQA